MNEIVYEKSLIDLLSSLSSINNQIIINNVDDKAKVLANNGDNTICYVLNAPINYFNMGTEQIGLVNYNLFAKYFGVFDNPSKKEGEGDIPKLAIGGGQDGDAIIDIRSTKNTQRYFQYRLAEINTLAKPLIKEVKVMGLNDSISGKTAISASYLAELKSRIADVSADTVKFNVKGNKCTIDLINSSSHDMYEDVIDIADNESNFTLQFEKDCIKNLPEGDYDVGFVADGFVVLKQKRTDEISLTMVLSEKV